MSILIWSIYKIFFPQCVKPSISMCIPLVCILTVQGRSALRDTICYSFLLCAVSQWFSIPYQFLENRKEQSCTQFSRLRSWERAPAWIPFSDPLQWPYLNVIYSVMSLLLKILNALRPFEVCYLLGFVFVQFFLLPKAALYEDI